MDPDKIYVVTGASLHWWGRRIYPQLPGKAFEALCESLTSYYKVAESFANIQQTISIFKGGTHDWSWAFPYFIHVSNTNFNFQDYEDFTQLAEELLILESEGILTTEQLAC